MSLFDCADFQSIPGKGASGLTGTRRIAVGSIRYFETLGGLVQESFARLLGAQQDGGKTCVLVGEIGAGTVRILGALSVADVVRAEAPGVVRALKEIGPVAMVGDGVNDAPALATATIGICDERSRHRPRHGGSRCRPHEGQSR